MRANSWRGSWASRASCRLPMRRRPLLDGHPVTTAQLRERLPDIPPATMYRHVGALAAAGVRPSPPGWAASPARTAAAA
jgi:hypothetical protein